MTDNEPGRGSGGLGYGAQHPPEMLSAGLSAGAPASFGTVGRGSRLVAGGGRRATVVSTVSTLVVVAGLVAVFLAAPGSSQVRHTFFDPHDMWQSFIGDPKKGYYSVGEAIWLNIRMFLAAEVLILILALVLALIRQSTTPVLFPLRVLAMIYVDFFRGVPLLLVVYAVGYGLPALDLAFISKLPYAVYGVIALTLSYSAYVSEVYRPGLNSVHRSQVAAARSLGLTQGTAMRYVILPQGIRNIVPPSRDIANRVCFLEEGTIIEEATPSELFSDPRDDRTRRFLRRIVDAGRM